MSLFVNKNNPLLSVAPQLLTAALFTSGFPTATAFLRLFLSILQHFDPQTHLNVSVH